MIIRPAAMAIMIGLAMPAITPALAQRGDVPDLTRAQQEAVWARDLIGTPVYGDGTGKIGAVDDVIVGPDGRATAVVVGLSGLAGTRQAHVPIPWEWVEPQIGLPTIVVPWTPEDVAWLRDAGRDPGTAGAGAGLAGWRSSWLDGTEARIAAGGTLGTVEGFIFSPDGQVTAIVVRRADGGPFYEIPRDNIRVQGDPPQVVIEMSRPEILALERTTRDPTPFTQPPEETPRRQTTPENEAYRERMLSELQQWENRIDRVAAELGEDATEVQALRRWHWASERAWQRLAQTSGPNFEVQRTHLEEAMDRMRSHWSEAAEALR